MTTGKLPYYSTYYMLCYKYESKVQIKLVYSSTSPTPCFWKMFNCSQFFTNFTCSFHIVDNDKLPLERHPSDRPSARIRPLLDYINSIKMYYYKPFENISVDESFAHLV